MGRIARRRTTITLYQGDLDDRLSAIRARLARLDVNGEPDQSDERFGGESEAMRLAKEHDELQEQGLAESVDVTLWALSPTSWDQLGAEFPPRENNAYDAGHGYDMSRFPDAVLCASLIEESRGVPVDDLLEQGAAFLEDLGDLTPGQHQKLRNAAWTMNAGDDRIPKLSLVSLLTRPRDTDSSSPDDSE